MSEPTNDPTPPRDEPRAEPRSEGAEEPAPSVREFAIAPSPVAQFQGELRTVTPRVFVTWALLAANVVMFLAMVASGVHWMEPLSAHLVSWGADYGPLTLGGQPWRLMTATFIHIGLLHLGMNMLVLGSAGPLVERLFGNLGFLALYLASGLAGSLTSIVWSPDIVSAGASGAIFGLYGGLMGFALRNKHSIPRDAFVQLLQRAGTFVLINVVYSFTQKNIDMAGHVGGLFGGFLAGLALARPLTPRGVSRRWVGAAAVLAATAAMVGVALVAIPEPVDVNGAIDHAIDAEKRSFGALQSALADVEEAGVTATADRIEREAIKPWDNEIAAMEKLDAPPRDRERVADVLRIMKEQRRILVDVADAVRADDIERFERAIAKLTKAKKEPASPK